jgi:hypothetical protein
MFGVMHELQNPTLKLPEPPQVPVTEVFCTRHCPLRPVLKLRLERVQLPLQGPKIDALRHYVLVGSARGRVSDKPHTSWLSGVGVRTAEKAGAGCSGINQSM